MARISKIRRGLPLTASLGLGAKSRIVATLQDYRRPEIGSCHPTDLNVQNSRSYFKSDDCKQMLQYMAAGRLAFQSPPAVGGRAPNLGSFQRLPQG